MEGKKAAAKKRATRRSKLEPGMLLSDPCLTTQLFMIAAARKKATAKDRDDE